MTAGHTTVTDHQQKATNTMATARKKTKKVTVDVENMNPTQLMAHEIVEEYGDLRPSVTRIMEAEISDDERHEALSLFQNSLGNLGDPNRDPRVAIANSEGNGGDA